MGVEGVESVAAWAKGTVSGRTTALHRGCRVPSRLWVRGQVAKEFQGLISCLETERWVWTAQGFQHSQRVFKSGTGIRRARKMAAWGGLGLAWLPLKVEAATSQGLWVAASVGKGKGTGPPPQSLPTPRFQHRQVLVRPLISC